MREREWSWRPSGRWGEEKDRIFRRAATADWVGRDRRREERKREAAAEGSPEREEMAVAVGILGGDGDFRCISCRGKIILVLQTINNMWKA